jgi:hypothetical protein
MRTVPDFTLADVLERMTSRLVRADTGIGVLGTMIAPSMP